MFYSQLLSEMSPHIINQLMWEVWQCYQYILWKCICWSKSRLQYSFVYGTVHQLHHSASLTLLDARFSWQLQLSIRLLSCAMSWWPCCLYPASPVWMTADKSPGLLLASPPLCNSTAGECALSYEAHFHKSTKDTGTNLRQIALKLQ